MFWGYFAVGKLLILIAVKSARIRHLDFSDRLSRIRNFHPNEWHPQYVVYGRKKAGPFVTLLASPIQYQDRVMLAYLFHNFQIFYPGVNRKGRSCINPRHSNFHYTRLPACIMSVVRFISANYDSILLSSLDIKKLEDLSD
jgi:hypothetical protein